MPLNGYVAIVDAYSSGSLYAAELNKRGYGSVHVQSQDPIPPDDIGSFNAAEHVANIVFDGDVDHCVRALAAYQPLCVLAGAEQGVNLADQLSEGLGLATSNGTTLSLARRDKFAMQRAVAAAGVRAIPTQFGTRWDELETWVTAHLPVVVKPPMSSGTDHVFICTTLEQARNAFHAIMAKPNTFGEINHGAVVQTKVEGTEYIVNHVSCDGRHYVTDIWRVDKVRGGRPVYDRGVLLPSQGEPQDAMVAYVTSILDALAIRFGPSHCELMLTESGPILIEIAARMHGQSPQPLCEMVMGFSQVTATLDAYLAPAKFRELAAAPYVLHKQLQRVELICPRSGRLRSLPRLDDIRAMPSFHKLKLYVEPGQRIVETTDLMSIPGFVDLIHPDPEVIERDHQQLRALELADFYDLVAD